MYRSLSADIYNDLLKGELNPLLNMVHEDSTLDMQLRGAGVTIYYRGGKLFEAVRYKEGYRIRYNAAYWHDGDAVEKKYSNLVENPSIRECVEYKALYKDQMDYHISKHNDPSAEAQVQQRIVLENNVLGKVGDKNGDYIFLDTEYVFDNPKTRKSGKFDAIALRWPIYSRMKRKDVGISVIEIKNGDDALSGKSGIKEHIRDFCDFVNDKERRRVLCDDMQEVFHQKCELGLIPMYTDHYFNNESYAVSIDESAIDLVFILANRNTMGTQVKREIKAVCEELSDKAKNRIFFATAFDMGYVMYRYTDGYSLTDRYTSLSRYMGEIRSE